MINVAVVVAIKVSLLLYLTRKIYYWRSNPQKTFRGYYNGRIIPRENDEANFPMFVRQFRKIPRTPSNGKVNEADQPGTLP